MYSLISILAKKYRLPKIHNTDSKKLDKKESPRRGNKIVMGDRGREGPEWERGGEERGTGSGTGEDRREAQMARRMNENMQLQGWGLGLRWVECSM